MSRFSHAIKKHTPPVLGALNPLSAVNPAFGVHALGEKGSGPGQPGPGAGSGNVPWEEGWQNYFSGAYGNNAEQNYSAYINSLNPEQLLKRYQNATQADVGTQQGILGTQDANNFQAYSTFKSLFGRAPTQGELSQVIPAFQGPNGHINGQAFLANLQQQYQQNPNMDPSKAISAGTAQGSVSQQFKSILGRDATPDEVQHFTQAIQSGQTDAYGLGSFLKQMPEYTNAQDKTFRSGLNTELQGYDTQEFNKEKGDVMADYQRRGLGTSPSLDYALTDLMGNIAKNRSAYLASLSASQYGGNKDLAVGNYQNSLNQMYQNNQSQRQNQQSMGNSLMSRGYEGADYSTQMNDYMRMLGQANQSRNVLHTGDWINMGLNGLSSGAKAYGASQGGGGFGYLNGGY